MISYSSCLQKKDDQTDIGHLMLERGFYGKVQISQKDSEKDKIVVHDRALGKLVEEKIPDYIRVTMRLMYQTGGGKFVVDRLHVTKILKHLTDQQGHRYNSANSKKEIEHFIQYHNLNREEILDPVPSFKNFNEFFYRKLKTSARPIAQSNNPKVAVSPADSRLNVFPTIDDATRIWIKGKHFTLQNLIKDDELANKYVGGSLVIARLAPQDYHRFHSPVDGIVGKFEKFNGSYYTVNPMAIREPIDVYTENKRQRVVLSSNGFGDVLFIAVGATMVGSIVFTVSEGQKVKKGEELGFFAFGGSTVLLLFQKGKIQYDHDLLANSSKPVETLVKIGESIGTASS